MGASTVSAVALLTILGIVGVDGDVLVKDLTTNATIKRYSDMQASFGLDFPLDGLEGWLVRAAPDPQACSPVRPPPVNETKCNETVCKYILLVARGGNCEFTDKVLYGQQQGYATVIVHNFIHNEEVFAMGGGTNVSMVTIPSTFVGYTSGMELLRYNYSLRRYTITVQEEDLINFPNFLWPFLLAMTVCIIVALIFLLVKLGREHASKKLNRLSSKHLKKIPVRKFKKGDYYDTCAICLDEYEEGEKIRVLPCDHVYHMKCIDPWLTKNKKTCPVCKRRVIPGKDGDSESETEGPTAPNEESENTPLLGGGSGQARTQSHGSIAEPGVSLNSESLLVQGQGNMDGDATGYLDLEHGAVGGEGISDRNKTLVTLAASNAGNIQEANETTDSHSERKRKRRDGRRTSGGEDATESSSLGSENRAEQRERRRLRKEKKKQKAESRQAQQGSEEAVPGGNNCEVDANAGLQAGEGVAGSVEEVQTRRDEEFGNDNPGFSESGEVVVASAGGQRREMRNVV